MKILLTGGGSGGHITPLLAVARELKNIDPNITVVAVCEKNAKFVSLFHDEPAVDEVYQVSAGKYRRFPGLTRMQRLFNLSVHAKNAADIGRVCAGYIQARSLLRRIKPDGVLTKGGFVCVPVGLAAAHMHIPIITHDSDAVPGLANRIVSRWALLHATGMPTEFYDYPKNKTRFMGVPVAAAFTHVTPALQKQYQEELGLRDCKQVIGIIGGSQGGMQLNQDVLLIIGRLMQHHSDLGVVHIVGLANEREMQHSYDNELLADERRRVVIKGFVSDAFRHTGAADVVVSRASATVVAELAVQGKASILVPGQLADDHQTPNARHLAEMGAAVYVPGGDSEGLYDALHTLLSNEEAISSISAKLQTLAKPNAAEDLAHLLIDSFTGGKVGSA